MFSVLTLVPYTGTTGVNLISVPRLPALPGTGFQNRALISFNQMQDYSENVSLLLAASQQDQDISHAHRTRWLGLGDEIAVDEKE